RLVERRFLLLRAQRGIARLRLGRRGGARQRTRRGLDRRHNGGEVQGFAAATAGRDCDAAEEAAAATSRTKPSLSSCAMSFSNSASKLLPTFCATSPSVARPSMAESTARSARLRRLVLPEASWTPLPDFE